jgi:hypothetical protein
MLNSLRIHSLLGIVETINNKLAPVGHVLSKISDFLHGDNPEDDKAAIVAHSHAVAKKVHADEVARYLREGQSVAQAERSAKAEDDFDPWG